MQHFSSDGIRAKLGNLLSATRLGFLAGHPLNNVRVSDTAQSQDLATLADQPGSGVTRVSIPADSAARVRFVREWMNKHQRKLASGALVSTLVLPMLAQAAQGEMVELAELDGIASTERLADGGMQITFADGRVVRLSAENIQATDGQVFVDSQALQAGLEAAAIPADQLDGVVEVVLNEDGTATITMEDGQRMLMQPEAIEVQSGEVMMTQSQVEAANFGGNYSFNTPLEGVSMASAGTATAATGATVLGGLTGAQVAMAAGGVGVVAAAAAASNSSSSSDSTSTTTNSTSDTTNPTSDTTSGSGNVQDGYIVDATVWLFDAEGRRLDDGNIRTSSESGKEGDFTYSVNGVVDSFEVRGGTDISTGEAFTGTLKAPAGSNVITPLTTLMAEGLSQEKIIGALFGSDSNPLPAGQKLTTYNPIAEGNAELVMAGVKVAAALNFASAQNGEDYDVTLNKLVTEINASSTGSVDLTKLLNADIDDTNFKALLEELEQIGSNFNVAEYANLTGGQITSLLGQAQKNAQVEAATAREIASKLADAGENAVTLTRDDSVDDISFKLDNAVEGDTVIAITSGMSSAQLQAMLNASNDGLNSLIDTFVGRFTLDISADGLTDGQATALFDAHTGSQVKLHNGDEPIAGTILQTILSNVDKLASGAIRAEDGIELTADQLITLLENNPDALEDGSAIVANITTLESDADVALGLENADKLAPESIEIAGALTIEDFATLATALHADAVDSVDAEGATPEQLEVLAANIDKLLVIVGIEGSTIQNLTLTNEQPGGDIIALLGAATGVSVNATGMNAVQLQEVATGIESVATITGTLDITSNISADDIGTLLVNVDVANSAVNVLTSGMADNQQQAVVNNLQVVDSLTIASGITLTVNDAGTIPEGLSIKGNGTLAVAGDVGSGPVSDGFTVATLDLTEATFADTFSLGESQVGALRITHAQADGLEFTGTSGADRIEVDVSGAFEGDATEAAIALNFSTLADNDHVVFDFGAEAGNTINLTGTLNFGGGTNTLEASNGTVNISGVTISGDYESINLAINSTLVMNAGQFQDFGDQLDALSGSGELQITQIDSSGVDLSVLSFTPGGANLPVIGLIFASQNALSGLESTGDGFVTAAWLESQNITLPTTQDVILQVDGGDGEYIDVEGYESGRFLFQDPAVIFNSTQFNDTLEAIETGAEGIRDTQASDVNTINLGNDVTLTSDQDISALDITLATGNRILTVAKDVTLTANADQIGGANIVGAGTLLVNVTGNALASTDFSGLGSLATLQLTDDATLGSDDELPELNLSLVNNAALTLTAAQASGRNIDASDGELTITGLGGEYVDLSGITGDVELSLASDTVVLNADTQLGQVTVNVAEDQTLTLSFRQVNDANFTGEGSVVARIGDDNLIGASLPDIISLAVQAGRTVTLTTDQADGLFVRGEGSVSLEATGSPMGDLSGVIATGARVINAGEGSAVIDSGTQLGGFIFADNVSVDITGLGARTVAQASSFSNLRDVGLDQLDFTLQDTASNLLNADDVLLDGAESLTVTGAGENLSEALSSHQVYAQLNPALAVRIEEDIQANTQDNATLNETQVSALLDYRAVMQRALELAQEGKADELFIGTDANDLNVQSLGGDTENLDIVLNDLIGLKVDGVSFTQDNAATVQNMVLDVAELANTQPGQFNTIAQEAVGDMSLLTDPLGTLTDLLARFQPTSPETGEGTEEGGQVFDIWTPFSSDPVSVEISDLPDGNFALYHDGVQVSRFKTAALELEDWSNDQKELRLVDLETGDTLAGRTLAANEQLIKSSGDDTYVIGEFNDDQLTLKTYDLSLPNPSVTTANTTVTASLALIPESYAIAAFTPGLGDQGLLAFNSYEAEGTDNWVGQFDIYEIGADGDLNSITAPLPQDVALHEMFVLEGELYLGVHEVDGYSQNYKLTADFQSLELLSDDDYYDARGIALGEDSVIRTGDLTLDTTQVTVPEGEDPLPSGGSSDLYSVQALGDGNTLARMEFYNTTGNGDIGYTHWLLLNSQGEVTKSHAFNDSDGVYQRIVQSPDNGYLYFQQLEVRFADNLEDSGPSYPNESDALLTLHRVAVSDVASVMESASATGIAGNENVEQVLSVTANDLGLSAQDYDIVFLDAASYDGNTGKLLLAVENNDTEAFSLVAIADGGIFGVTEAPVENEDLDQAFEAFYNFIVSASSNDQISVDAANNIIDLSAGGSDTLTFGATQSENGTDTVIGFSTGDMASGGDVIGIEGADLSDENVTFSTQEIDTAISNLNLADGDVMFVFAGSTDTDVEAVLARVEGGQSDYETLVNFEELQGTLADFGEENLQDFNSITA